MVQKSKFHDISDRWRQCTNASFPGPSIRKTWTLLNHTVQCKDLTLKSSYMVGLPDGGPLGLPQCDSKFDSCKMAVTSLVQDISLVTLYS